MGPGTERERERGWRPANKRKMVTGTGAGVRNVNGNRGEDTWTSTRWERDGSVNGNESSSGDGNEDRDGNGDEDGNEDGIGEGGNEEKKRKKSHKRCRCDVGNGDNLDGKRENVHKKGLVQ